MIMQSNNLRAEDLKKLVIASFMAEKNRDLQTGLDLIDEDFTVTEMIYGEDGKHLPSLNGEPLRDLMGLAFTTKDRDYVFKSVVADEQTQTVIVEFIESYPDPATGQVYRTPQISVCQVKDGKIHRTRHYMDPRLSFEHLSESQIDSAFN